jgi:hypothetical protein
MTHNLSGLTRGTHEQRKECRWLYSRDAAALGMESDVTATHKMSTPNDPGQDHPYRPDPGPRRRVGEAIPSMG